ncbi:MAG TPA: response regulator [Burkholderiales bacterium]|jgi:DNA-binding response OmpR family regulator|nr:response regulator [Burkholderiales bacterium]
MMKSLIGPQAAAYGRRPAGENILVVEPDEDLREDMRLHLKLAGYQVATAEDGVVAGHHVLHHPTDLVLARDRMPYLSGEELAAALRDEYPKLPVIVLTRTLLPDELLETVARELELFGQLH